MSEIKIIHADCMEAMRSMEADSIDAIVCDPPYGLEFMGRDWDAPWKQEGSVLHDPSVVGGFQDGNGGNPFSRSRIRYGGGGSASHGFQVWCEEWAREAFRVAKPGAHLVAFGGTRMFHRLACGIEDAGWEIRDCLSWNYGSGFPKSLNVSKAIEKLGEDTHGLLPEEQKFCDWMREESGLDAATVKRITGSARFITGEVEIVNTATVDNPRWGRRAMVPTDAAWKKLLSVMTVTPPEWIVELVKDPPSPPIEHPGEWKPGRGQGTQGTNKWQGWGTALKPAWEPAILARKPLDGTVAANVLAHGTGAINVDACRILGEPVPVFNTRGGRKFEQNHTQPNRSTHRIGTSDIGRWPSNVALDEEAATMLDEQSGGLRKSQSGPNPKNARGIGFGHSGQDSGMVGYGDEGGASRFFYTAKASRTERGEGNVHPTVKPIALMRWLVKLVCPPGGTVLDPFSGSGSTLLAAKAENINAIGIEREDEYVGIIKRRLENATPEWLRKVEEESLGVQSQEGQAPVPSSLDDLFGFNDD